MNSTVCEHSLQRCFVDVLSVHSAIHYTALRYPNERYWSYWCGASVFWVMFRKYCVWTLTSAPDTVKDCESCLNWSVVLLQHTIVHLHGVVLKLSWKTERWSPWFESFPRDESLCSSFTTRHHLDHNHAPHNSGLFSGIRPASPLADKTPPSAWTERSILYVVCTKCINECIIEIYLSPFPCFFFRTTDLIPTKFLTSSEYSFGKCKQNVTRNSDWTSSIFSEMTNRTKNCTENEICFTLRTKIFVWNVFDMGSI